MWAAFLHSKIEQMIRNKMALNFISELSTRSDCPKYIELGSHPLVNCELWCGVIRFTQTLIYRSLGMSKTSSHSTRLNVPYIYIYMVTQSELETEGELGNSDQTIDILLGQYQITEEYCWLMQISACITYKKKNILYMMWVHIWHYRMAYAECWYVCSIRLFITNNTAPVRTQFVRTSYTPNINTQQKTSD